MAKQHKESSMVESIGVDPIMPTAPPQISAPAPAPAPAPAQPRILKPNDRASGGLRRFRIRPTDGVGHPVHYVLAADAGQATEVFNKAIGRECPVVVVPMPD